MARTIDLAIAHLKVLKTTAEKSSHAMTSWRVGVFFALKRPKLIDIADVLANIRINAENKEAERLTNTGLPGCLLGCDIDCESVLYCRFLTCGRLFKLISFGVTIINIYYGQICNQFFKLFGLVCPITPSL